MSTPASSTPRIFVSHSHRDNAFCKSFVDALMKQLGVNDETTIFYDVRDLQVSAVWMDEIQRQVIARPIFIVLLTPHSIHSPYVKLEVNLALKETIERPEKRQFIGVLVEQCDVGSFVPAIALYQMANVPRNGRDAAIASVVEAIRQPKGPADNQTRVTDPTGDTVALARWLGRDAQNELLADHREDARLKAQYALDLLGEGESLLAVALRDILAQAFLGTEQWQDACDMLEAIPKPARNRPEYWRWLAEARRQLQKYDAALEALKYVRIFTPHNDTAARRVWLAERRAILAELERWDEALATVADEQAIATAQNRVALVQAKYELLKAAGRAPDALSVAEALIVQAHVDPLTATTQTPIANQNRDFELPVDGDDVLAGESDQPQPSPQPAFPTPQRPKRLAEGMTEWLASQGFVSHSTNGVAVISPPLCHVDAGHFLMGSDVVRDPQAESDEQPQKRIKLPAFQIARFPVTVAEYAHAVRAGAVREPPLGTDDPSVDDLFNWSSQLKRLDHPVVCVSWHDANAYATWLTEITGQPWRLPTEAEWEKAARWDEARQVPRIYPWGDAWDQTRANTIDGGPGETTPVGAYPNGASPCGAQEMVGNVWEWTSSVYQLYTRLTPEGNQPSSVADSSYARRAFRGGSWFVTPKHARAAYRNFNSPTYFDIVVGFRLAI